MKLLRYSMALMLGVMLLAGRATGQNAQTVSYKSGEETVSGYLVTPTGRGPHPGLVVIQEWWGLNDWIREQARKLAAEGYVALAVDLYRGRTATERDEAHELSRALPPDRALRDLKAAFDYLQSRSDVKKKAIGAIGWCMGGGYALTLAVNEPRLRACVVNYGAMPTEKESIEKIQAKVLGIFGAEDRGITPESVRAFEQAMNSAGKSVEVKIYEGAGHAFQNPNNKAGYRPEATKDSWERTVRFLATTLKG